MAALQVIAVNGALTDSLVSNFGGSAAGVPSDYRLCIDKLSYSGRTATTLELYLAVAAGGNAEDHNLIVTSSSQLAYEAPSWIVPRVAATGVPYSLWITKGAVNANIILGWKWIPPGGC